MEEKNFRSNKLTHLFETLLQQEEQEKQQEQEQEELEQQEEEDEKREQAERATIPSFVMMGGGSAGGGRRKASESMRLLAHGQGQGQGQGHGHGQSEWSAEAVSCLLDSYAEKLVRGRGFLRNSDWEEVACTLNAREHSRGPKSVRQCRDKVDSLKKRYKLEKKKAADSGCSLVSWPLYGKIDEMMTCQSMVSRIPGGVDAGVKLPFSEPSHPDAFRVGSEQHGFAAENVYGMPFRKKGKMTIMEDTDVLSEDDDSDSSSHQHRQDKHSNRTGSLDEGSHSRRGPGQAGVSEKASTRKRKAKSVDPIQSLADAVVGFSDVFARIEMAKMEIYTKMKLEIAKLEKKNWKWGSSSSSSSSET